MSACPRGLHEIRKEENVTLKESWLSPDSTVTKVPDLYFFLLSLVTTATAGYCGACL